MLGAISVSQYPTMQIFKETVMSITLEYIMFCCHLSFILPECELLTTKKHISQYNYTKLCLNVTKIQKMLYYNEHYGN